MSGGNGHPRKGRIYHKYYSKQTVLTCKVTMALRDKIDNICKEYFEGRSECLRFLIVTGLKLLELGLVKPETKKLKKLRKIVIT